MDLLKFLSLDDAFLPDNKVISLAAICKSAGADWLNSLLLKSQPSILHSLVDELKGAGPVDEKILAAFRDAPPQCKLMISEIRTDFLLGTV